MPGGIPGGAGGGRLTDFLEVGWYWAFSFKWFTIVLNNPFGWLIFTANRALLNSGVDPSPQRYPFSLAVFLTASRCKKREKISLYGTTLHLGPVGPVKDR